MENYNYGRKKELQVGEFLERYGCTWSRSLASRGPADLHVEADIGRGAMTALLIQVKATRKDQISTSRLSMTEEKELMLLADQENALPVLALTAGNDVWVVTVPEHRMLFNGKLEELEREYPDET